MAKDKSFYLVQGYTTQNLEFAKQLATAYASSQKGTIEVIHINSKKRKNSKRINLAYLAQV